jgi:hypothetical protein
VASAKIVEMFARRKVGTSGKERQSGGWRVTSKEKTRAAPPVLRGFMYHAPSAYALG